MWNKFKTSIELVKIALQYVKKDWELLVYSILSLLASLAILVTFIWGEIYLNYDSYTWTSSTNITVTDDQWVTGSAIHDEVTSSDVKLYIFMFVYYFVFSFISLFFNTAIITSVQRRIEWKDNKFWDGMRDACKHLKAIFIWAFINATVTTILKILQNRFWENSLVGKIIIGLIWWMWNILTFFSFPLMIINGMWPKDAIKESGTLFKKTWWERAILHVWVGFIFWIAILWCFLLSMWIIFLGLPIVGFLFLVTSITTLMILSSTADTIIKTILLHYAHNWSLPWGLDSSNEVIINLATEPKL